MEELRDKNLAISKMHLRLDKVNSSNDAQRRLLETTKNQLKQTNELLRDEKEKNIRLDETVSTMEQTC